MEKNDFLTKYISNRGMQNINKSEYEQIVFYWIVKKCKAFGAKDFQNLSAKDLYLISDELGLEISKVKNLVKKMMFIRDEDENKKTELSIGTVILNHLNSAVYIKENSMVEISVENPIELEFIKRVFAEKQALYDTSFSNSILKFQLFALSRLVTASELNNIIATIKQSLQDYQNSLPPELKSKESEIKDEIKKMQLENDNEKSLSCINNIFAIIASVSTIAVNLIH
ncbi:MAG: hypothetical protein SPL22_09895 [Treponema sp.]|uniref:hypothetical protein n=1 Tax=Treponema sp. TaxID=166 RepID=UPI002A9159B5|nr:hypothetical protein [Treponema sp.]MDY6398028.1 hypothetical protein [Treponema sp.]